MVKIFIDPGHGGADPGAVANGLKEKDICLMIGILLRDFLNKEYVGHRIKLSRETDISLTLKERTDLANSWVLIILCRFMLMLVVERDLNRLFIMVAMPTKHGRVN